MSKSYNIISMAGAVLLLAGAVFSVRNTVAVGPVVVALDDEIFSAAFALLKLQSGL